MALAAKQLKTATESKSTSRIFKKMRLLTVRVTVACLQSELGDLTRRLSEYREQEKELAAAGRKNELLEEHGKEQEALVKRLQNSISSYQTQLEQTLSQLNEVNTESAEKSQCLVKAEDKLKTLQLKLTRMTPKLKSARQEHEKTTDLLFEEKKNNIKLMKQVQQLKMNNHQQEYLLKDCREQNESLKVALDGQLTTAKNE